MRHAAGIVLAAGLSRRLGRAKQLLVLNGEILLERAVRTALEAGLSPVVAVVQASLREMAGEVVARLESRGCVCIVNPDAGEGMGSSIRVGVEAVDREKVTGAVVMTCDQVAVTAEHLRALYEQPGQTAGSGYAGKVGVPAYFPLDRFAELLALRGDRGARELLHGAHVVATEALALDVDTEEELARAEAWVRESRG